VDVAAGRAVAFPAAVFTSGININYRRLPHHLADFEFSVRAARCGFPILLARDICVYSFNDFVRPYSRNPIRRLFHISSPDRLSAYWAFWRTVSPSESRARTLSKLLRYRILPQVLRSLRDLVALRTGRALVRSGRP
jgi:GT2 family glycosyltransferase